MKTSVNEQGNSEANNKVLHPITKGVTHHCTLLEMSSGTHLSRKPVQEKEGGVIPLWRFFLFNVKYSGSLVKCVTSLLSLFKSRILEDVKSPKLIFHISFGSAPPS